jgi:hypothetical protein
MFTRWPAESAYGIDDLIVDAKGIVGRGRSGSWRAVVVIAMLGAGACNQRVDLGDIGDGPASLLWKATFEPGNLSEWESDGQGGPDFANNAASGTAAATVALAHGGKTSGVVGVVPMGSMPAISYLCRDQPTPPEAYYSAWFYVPSGLELATGEYLSLVHFRDTVSVSGMTPPALWDVNLYPVGDGTVAAQLYDYPAANKIAYDLQQSFPPIRFPLDRWVQLEVYLAKALDTTGHVTVWQDGVQILDRPNVATVVHMDSLQWDVGGGSAGLTSGSTLVYVDDAAISLTRRGPDATF